jgi:hypothetical protein
MIRFNCPECGATIRTPDEAGGLLGKCPSCRIKVKVPGPPDPVLELEAPPPKKGWRLFRGGISAATLSTSLALVGFLYMVRVDWWVRAIPFALAGVGIVFSIRALKDNEKLYLVAPGLLFNLLLAGLAAFVSMRAFLPQ